jgi:hypothetical protein
MAKMSTFMISIIVASLIITIFGIFLNEGGRKYGVSEGSINLSKYNKLDEMSERTKDIRDNTETIKQQQGIVDIVGGFFSNAFKVLLLTKDSIDTVDAMSNQALSDASLGVSTKYFRIAISTIIIIFIFIGVVISATLKWET